mmetsp:Transcript_62272/g.175542  ORF Transcript_62272/g.175542 Transcript_62272/m.175542 type:complete len:231 (+) Transcript_62272:157-849(+)
MRPRSPYARARSARACIWRSPATSLGRAASWWRPRRLRLIVDWSQRSHWDGSGCGDSLVSRCCASRYSRRCGSTSAPGATPGMARDASSYSRSAFHFEIDARSELSWGLGACATCGGSATSSSAASSSCSARPMARKGDAPPSRHGCRCRSRARQRWAFVRFAAMRSSRRLTLCAKSSSPWPVPAAELPAYSPRQCEPLRRWRSAAWYCDTSSEVSPGESSARKESARNS